MDCNSTSNSNGGAPQFNNVNNRSSMSIPNGNNDIRRSSVVQSSQQQQQQMSSQYPSATPSPITTNPITVRHSSVHSATDTTAGGVNNMGAFMTPPPPPISNQQFGQQQQQQDVNHRNSMTSSSNSNTSTTTHQLRRIHSSSTIATTRYDPNLTNVNDNSRGSSPLNYNFPPYNNPDYEVTGNIPENFKEQVPAAFLFSP
jgi:hypothetical protein